MTVEATARKAKDLLEPLVGMIYFVPEGPANYEKIGLKPRQAYFCTRVSAMGTVPGEVVAATFYNFNPEMVIPQVNDGWTRTNAQEAAKARNQAVIESLSRLLADESGNLPDVSRALTLVKKACEGLQPHGRPLFAAYQGHPWPEDNDLLALWWGANLLREYRGDGHIAALLANEISGIEATLIAGAWSSRVPFPLLLKTRAWREEQVAEAYQGLAERDLLRDGALTEKGRALRDEIENITDRLAVAPWQKLGDEAQEFLGLVGAFSKQIVEQGGLGAARKPEAQTK
jgi:hypothetical protein